MALFSSALHKRHLLEICGNKPSFWPFVYSVSRNYRTLTKYASSQMVSSPCLFSMFDDGTKMNFNVRHYGKGAKSKRSYYDVLSVKPNATQSQIKTAYYTLSKKHHPDTKTGDNENVIFLEINEAYEVLGNLRKRRLYDRGVFRHNQPHDVHDYKEENEEARPESEFQSPINDGPKKRKVYTGHTKIYNFDEHYRKHYSNLFHRTVQVEENKRRREKMIKHSKLERESSKACILACVIFGTIMYISFQLPS